MASKAIELVNQYSGFTIEVRGPHPSEMIFKAANAEESVAICNVVRSLIERREAKVREQETFRLQTRNKVIAILSKEELAAIGWTNVEA